MRLDVFKMNDELEEQKKKLAARDKLIKSMSNTLEKALATEETEFDRAYLKILMADIRNFKCDELLNKKGS